LNFVEDLPVINGSLIHKCLTYQRRKQKTTPTNDKMTATVPTILYKVQFVYANQKSKMATTTTG
jgi:hypothetical protein